MTTTEKPMKQGGGLPYHDYHYTVVIGIALAVIPYVLMRFGSTNDFLEAIGVRQLYADVNMAQELAFSRVRHASDWNKMIHMVTNPVIFLTELVLLDHTPALIGLPASISKYLKFNLAGIYLLFFIAYYMAIDSFAGTFASLYLIWRYACIGRFGRMVGKVFGNEQRATTVALARYVFSHFLQIFVGHILIEQFYDLNMFHTFFLQQLVAVYEILFKIDARLELGYLDELDKEVNGLLDEQREIMLSMGEVEAPDL